MDQVIPRGAPRQTYHEPPDEVRAFGRVASDGVAWSVEGGIAWVNDRLVEIAGRFTGLVGTKLEDFFLELADGLPAVGAVAECEIERPNGERRAVLCRCASCDRHAGTATWVIEDLTRPRRLEQELLEAAKELSSVHRELAAMRVRARHERAELLEEVSHELRTPLTVIGGYHRLLLGDGVGPLNDAQRKFLAESQKSCQRLDALVESLLHAARSAQGGEVLELGNAPLPPLVEGIAAMFQLPLAERRLRLSLAFDPAADVARFDPLRVEQVLTNLVGNAVRFTPPGGAIEIATRAFAAPDDPQVRRWVEISVGDDGPGIPASERERVFEPYVQLGEREEKDGLGLGLAICRRLVEAHGGRIAIGERAGGGCRVAFTLPAEPPR